MTTNSSEAARRHVERVLPLVALCPDRKALKVRDKERIAECTRDGATARLTLKMGLRSDVTGAALLHAIFRVTTAPDGSRDVSLHHLEGKREIDELTNRQERYLSALLTWAERVLPTARPVARPDGPPPWQRDFAALYGHLSGCSAAVALRRLRDGFFADQEDVEQDTARMDAFLEVLRDEERVVLVDHGEETIDALAAYLAEQRLDVPCEGFGSSELHALVAEAGLTFVALEDGSDGGALAIVPVAHLDTVEALLARVAPDTTLHR